jgi:hypothetical protein
MAITQEVVRPVERVTEMAALVRLEGTEGDVLFEGEFDEAALEEIGIGDQVGDVIAATNTRLSDLGSTIRRCTAGLYSTFEDIEKRKIGSGALSEATMELGVKVSGEGNIIVAKGTAEANIVVTITWTFG